jgi:SAM-dependent methyltransferase
VPDPILARMTDRVPANLPYSGVLAEAYDTWISIDERLPEESAMLRILDGIDGPILELGCGTGRPLLRWLDAGMDVEGIDSSADMLAILRRHAAERGLDPTVHHGDFAPLTLDGTYAAMVCVAGSFTLVDDRAQARRALASYLARLRPGGLLAITLVVPSAHFDEEFAWRLRRTGTNPDGTSYLVHEAIRCDRDDQLQVTYNRMETFDAGGHLISSDLRRFHLRWWTRDEFSALLASLGYVDVGAVGGTDGWIAVGHRSA